MGAVVVARFGEVPVVALGCGFDGLGLFQLVRLGQHGQATHRLDILGPALAHQQRTLRVLLQVMGVLGDTADQYQRATRGIQAVRHHGTERKAWHGLGMGREHPA
ncbi:phosphodiesterase, MJ0936 family protein, partial [Corchorus olitorius]